MILTAIELQVMILLWIIKVPLTSAEIIAASYNRTWKDSSIHIIMRSLLRKGAVVLSSPKPTGTNNARSYIPAFSFEEYALSIIYEMDKYSKPNNCIDYEMIINGIIAMKEG